MKNSEILKAIIEKVEQEHKNLYHDISKEEVQKYISTIKNIDNLSPIEFDYEMLKLFALFKDAHTSYRTCWKDIDQELLFLNGKFYIFIDEQYKEIKNFGNKTCNEFYNEIVPLICYETEEWLNYRIFWIVLGNGYFYELLGIANEEQFIITTIDNEEINVKICEPGVLQKPKQMPYTFNVLNDNILYIKYFRCIDNECYPFVKFVEDIEKEIDQRNIKKYILDVRHNIGGGSEVLNPFQKLVGRKKLEGVLLINNGTFSAGRFAVARFKKAFNTPLIGETTGGAVKSYGQGPEFQIKGKKFSASQKYFDFSDIVDYEGGFKPDVYVPTTIEDLNNKYDRQLDVAIQVLKNNEKEIY